MDMLSLELMGTLWGTPKLGKPCEHTFRESVHHSLMNVPFSGPPFQSIQQGLFGYYHELNLLGSEKPWVPESFKSLQ